MKALLFTTIFFISSLLQAQTNSKKIEWLMHTDTAYNISIQYPSNWELKPPRSNARFFVTSYAESETDKFRDNINCAIPIAVDKSRTIQMAEREITETLSGMLPDFKIIHSGYSKWNGADAYEIEYTCSQTSNGTTYSLHMLQKVAIIKGKLYTLTFTSEEASFAKYIDTVQKMLRSFKVK